MCLPGTAGYRQSAVRDMVSTILHRCLYYTGWSARTYRARRELPPGIWLDLHGYYETAEEWGLLYAGFDVPLEATFKHALRSGMRTLLLGSKSPAPTATVFVI